jgi:hypothetical protein
MITTVEQRLSPPVAALHPSKKPKAAVINPPQQPAKTDHTSRIGLSKKKRNGPHVVGSILSYVAPLAHEEEEHFVQEKSFVGKYHFLNYLSSLT